MKKILKRLLQIFLALLLIACIWKIELVIYGIRQLKGQLSIIRNSVPIAEVLDDKELDSRHREKLLEASGIRIFAMDSLGLKDSKNYTTYYDQHGKPLMWVVTACLPYELKAKEWWFPMIGNVSYKGFFNETLAIREAQQVRDEGYETDIYSPAAWSTLGFFNDPIFSGMLKRGTGRIAELIIHELTHSTIYLKSSVEFNENLATFIGERGALYFLASKYGVQSEAYKRYRGYLSDEIIYSEYMMKGATRLDSLYKSFNSMHTVKEKALAKYRLIAGIMSGINRLPLSYPERYRHDFKKSKLPGNSEFMAFLRYRNKQETFSSLLEEKFSGDIRLFIAGVKNDPGILKL
jgi:predicted aminopeptidase